jgi:hypothetical protein
MNDDVQSDQTEHHDAAAEANRERARQGMQRLRARRKAAKEAREAAGRPVAPSTAKSDAQRQREARQRARERTDAVRAFLTDVLAESERAMDKGYASASHAGQAVTAQELLEQLDAVQSVALEDSLAIAFFIEGVQDDPEGRAEVTRDVETAFESRQRSERRREAKKGKAGAPTLAVMDQLSANVTWAYERLKSDEGPAPADINAGLAAAKRLIQFRGAPERQADLREFATIVQVLSFHDWMDQLSTMEPPDDPNLDPEADYVPASWADIKASTSFDDLRRKQS